MATDTQQKKTATSAARRLKKIFLL